MELLIKSNYNQENDTWEVSITGEVDIFSADELKNNLLSLISQKKANMKIDATDLNYIDSTALGALVAVLKNVKEYNGDMCIVNLKSSLLRLFKITNLDKVFNIEVN